ncbi:MAG: tRNA (guanosine(46)-N7)-methyltransferase TrmB [Kiritimatiellae bacterium]|nr:tRNA (guanosine(46)-N7)-methyltransferase TrmB [Kiritimatiellia bacterium]
MDPIDPIVIPENWTHVLSIDSIFPAPAEETRSLAVDVGCGKGRYLVAVAQKHPEMNFLGIDRMRSRMVKLGRKLTRAGLDHVRLIQVEASYAIRHLLPENSVSVFTVFFPDPWPKRRHHRRRLFRPAFLDDLDRAMKPGAQIHIATDHLDYFESVVPLFEADSRFDSIPAYEPTEDERTEFEHIFAGQGKPIGRASFAKRA